MENARGVAELASLFGDPSRAEILLALLGGQALTASELAQIASVTKPTVSAHVAKLLAAGLVAREIQGRHRYFRLANRDVARLLEGLMGVADRNGVVRARVGPRDPALRKARVCYDHLAGELGVLVFESLEARACLRSAHGGLDLTGAGRRCFAVLGIDVASLENARRPLCRACLDWSARRPHLAGALGAALLERVFALGWARRVRRSRVVHFSALGEDALRCAFPVPES